MAEQLPPEILARGDLLKLGAAAGLGFAALPLVQPSAPRNRVARTPVPLALAAQPGVLDLYINEGYLKMVDDTLVYHRGFGSRPTDDRTSAKGRVRHAELRAMTRRPRKSSA